MTPKRILVTGAAGFIGSDFVRLACSKGYTVVGLDLLTYAGHRENLTGLPKESFDLIVGDIGNSQLVSQLLKEYEFSAVLNFAAESHVDRSIEGPGVFVKTNVLGTANLLDQCLRYWQASGQPESFRYLQVSTDEVYGSLALEGTDKFREETPISPSSPYSASKAGADHLVQAWNHTFKLPTLITRCSNNYGPRQFPEKLIPTMIRCALAGKALPVYGKGINVRDWIHVDDHCAGIMLALEKGKPGSVYCFGGRSEVPNLEVVRRICTTLDKLSPRKDGKSYAEQISFVTDRLGHDLRYAIDDSKAERELGFARSHSFATGLEATIKWYLGNQAWCEAVMNSEKH